MEQFDSSEEEIYEYTIYEYVIYVIIRNIRNIRTVVRSALALRTDIKKPSTPLTTGDETRHRSYVVPSGAVALSAPMVYCTARNEFFIGADVQEQVPSRRGVTADDLRLP